MAVYLPAPADYDGNGQTDLGVLRFNDNFPTAYNAQATYLVQPSPTASATQSIGSGLGLSGVDIPTPADFDGDHKADQAVYGYVNNTYYGENYGTQNIFAGPEPFPYGAGRFAYIPSSGIYPAHNLDAVNGTLTSFPTKIVVVNIGQLGDNPAVGDYDGDGKADFAVYEPSKAQFLVYPSSTFNYNNDPTKTTGGLVVLPFGKVGDIPAPADYQGSGHTNFAVYEPDLGRFLVLPAGGGNPITVSLGGPGFVPVSADFAGLGHAQYAVYSSSKGQFLYLPALGAQPVTLSVGSPGELPAVGKFDGGTHVEFASFNAVTAVYHILSATTGVVGNRAMPDPNDIPVPRLDDFGINEFQTNLVQLNATRPDVLFLGDSITQRFTTVGASVWQTRMTQFNALDLGSVGDTTQNLLWRVENGAVATQPKVIVLTIGTNDAFTYLRSAADMADSIETIIQQIHLRSPNSSILLDGTFPLPPEYSGDSDLNKIKYTYAQGSIAALDTFYLPSLAPSYVNQTMFGYLHGDYYLNLVNQFNTNPNDPNDYTANQALFIDGLHPNAAGYEVWADNIVTPIRLLLHKPITQGDFDGDGKTDIGVYGPAIRAFATTSSLTGVGTFLPYGIAGAGQTLLATGDYDGDGKADYAVYGPSVGGFAIHDSSTNTDKFISLGSVGVGQSLPAPGDYDGDGRTDLTVYEPALNGFEIRFSKTDSEGFAPFGVPGLQAIPVPGDFDGDGKTDLALFYPAYAVFAYRPSSGGSDVYTQFGFAGAGQTLPTVGDFDGDGKTDLGIYLPNYRGFVYRPSSGGPVVVVPYGIAGPGQSIPALGDYDGDGKTDLAVYGPAVRGFAIHKSALQKDLFVPYGIAGAGQSIPTTSLDATISNSLGQPLPAGQTVDLASLTSPASKAKLKTGQTVPSGPLIA